MSLVVREVVTVPEQSVSLMGFSSTNLWEFLHIFSKKYIYLLSPVNSYRKGDEENDIVEQSVASLERKSNSYVPLYSKDNHPQHSHGDGDLLHRVGQVGNHSVVPVILFMIMVVDNDVVK